MKVLLDVIVGIAIVIGLLGIVIPVLPGSILVGLAILAWAAISGTPSAWVVGVVCVLLVGAGMALTWWLTAHRTRAAGVSTASLTLAGIAGIIGFFVVPLVGLALFFPLGLFVAEYVRLHGLGRTRPAADAWASTLVALKAAGLGLLGELALALVASALWLSAVLNGA